MKKQSEWKQVGEISVDAGICWLGDPCYILHRTKADQKALEKSIGNDWSGFCDRLAPDVTQFNHALGYSGLGVVVSTGYGDGVYPVLVRHNADGRIAEVKVIFAEGE